MNNDTILVVNDAPDQLELLAFILEKAGHRVLTALNGIEGLTVAQRETPALIISDILMPEMNGIDFCRQIRAHEKLHSTPFLLASVLQKEAAGVIEGLEAGAYDFF
jgi:CheY-like chemotaxis protein